MRSFKSNTKSCDSLIFRALENPYKERRQLAKDTRYMGSKLTQTKTQNMHIGFIVLKEMPLKKLFKSYNKRQKALLKVLKKPQLKNPLLKKPLLKKPLRWHRSKHKMLK